MKASIFGLLAETSIHPGAGQDTGFVDLPVAREAATDYPVVVGSSFKGALLSYTRDLHKQDAGQWSEEQRNRVFGKQEHGGSLVVSDVRLVLLPIRSLTSHYKWVTCPHLLERLQRDMHRVGQPMAIADLAVDDQQFLGAVETGHELFLEERQFRCSGPLPADVLKTLEPLIATATTRKRLVEQVVIISDSDFSWFARYGLAINARNVLDNEKKTSKNLWYEETIPPDSLFYTLLFDRNDGTALSDISSMIKHHGYIQVGGNETVGQGWFAVTEIAGGNS